MTADAVAAKINQSVPYRFQASMNPTAATWPIAGTSCSSDPTMNPIVAAAPMSIGQANRVKRVVPKRPYSYGFSLR